jgi:hypothetical protein
MLPRSLRFRGVAPQSCPGGRFAGRGPKSSTALNVVEPLETGSERANFNATTDRFLAEPGLCVALVDDPGNYVALIERVTDGIRKATSLCESVC